MTTRAHAAVSAPAEPPSVRADTCPLCHTPGPAIAADASTTRASWTCTRCGQIWTHARLETVAAYMRHAAAH